MRVPKRSTIAKFANATLSAPCGIVVAIASAPGPDFATLWPAWPYVVKVAFGYLAWSGVSATASQLRKR